MNPALYIVATPIGNLQDITFRAVEILQHVDWIAAEDTRHSKRLLTHYNVSTRLFSLHEHNEQQRIASVTNYLAQGQSVALISDAGTPLISDPGFRLVVAVQDAGFSVIPVPGASSIIAALCGAGLPTDRFVFEGFLPAKGEKRSKRLALLQEETRTIIFLEAVHRIIDLLEQLVKLFGGARMACIARELTKTYETIKRASLLELLTWLQQEPQHQKGEFVVMVAGNPKEKNEDLEEVDRVLKALLPELPVSHAVRVAEKISGKGRRLLYRRALVLSGQADKIE